MIDLTTAEPSLLQALGLQALPVPLSTLLASTAVALALTVAVEQSLVGALRRLMLQREPMVSNEHAVAGYERTLWTWASRDVRWLWVGLLVTAACATLAVHADPLWALTTLAALAASVQWDLATWECVAISPWQITWRRGWRRSVRRVPTAQVARVHVVERVGARRRGDDGPSGLLDRLSGLSGGSCYLALELHDGSAVKLPRTDRWTGLTAVNQSCEVLRQRLHERVLARRDAARSQQRAAARRARQAHAAPDAAADSAPGALSDPASPSQAPDAADVARLRAARRSQAQQRALSAYHDLPPPDPTRPAGPDTLMLN